MTEPTRKLFIEAHGNNDFWKDLKDHDSSTPKIKKPKLLWGNLEATIVAAVYEGWLIAKGEFNENKYYK